MMNTRSLKLIREVIINSGKWTSIEIAQDSIYRFLFHSFLQ